MKKLIALIFMVSVAFVSCKNEKAQEEASAETTQETVEQTADNLNGTYTVSVDNSKLNWKGFKPTGTHYGTVALKEGSFTMADGNVTEGNFVFDMTSITVEDIPAEDENNGKLMGHLKSPDFFDVANHQTASFSLTEAVKTESGYTFKGDLTVKGISKTIEFPVNVTSNENGVVLTAEAFQIDRTQYDIKFKSKSFFDNLKDNFINDEIEIAFNVAATK